MRGSMLPAALQPALQLIVAVGKWHIATIGGPSLVEVIARLFETGLAQGIICRLVRGHLVDSEDRCLSMCGLCIHVHMSDDAVDLTR